MTVRVALNNIAVRRGLIFGAYIAAGGLIQAVSAALFASGALGVTPASFGSAFQYNLLTQGLLGGAVSLATFVLLICAGASAYKRLRQIGAGAIAGLVAGALGGLVGALATGAVFAYSLSAYSPPLPAVEVSATLATSVTTIVLGLVWECVVGAGLGALGALIRQSAFN